MGNRTWTARQLALLKKEYPVCDSTRDLAKKLRVSYEAMKSKATVLKLKRRRHAGPWSLEKDRQLKKWYADTTNVEIGRRLGLSESQVIARAFKLRLRKSCEFMLMHAAKTAFRKGHVPANKGRKITEYMSADAIGRSSIGRFKKGRVSLNKLPNGTIRLRHSAIARGGKAFKVIKVRGKWIELQRHLWQKKYGKIKKGMCLWCKSKDLLNCDPENWELITRGENVKRNSASINLKDGFVAFTIVGKKNRHLYEDVKMNKKLIEAKRQQLKLNRLIHESQSTN